MMLVIVFFGRTGGGLTKRRQSWGVTVVPTCLGLTIAQDASIASRHNCLQHTGQHASADLRLKKKEEFMNSHLRKAFYSLFVH